MNTRSAYPAEPGTRPAASPDARGRVLVWDAPVRVFHVLMIGCFAGAYATAELERWRLVHVTLGYTMGALVAFRVLWGLIGTRHARFASFVRGPAAVLAYLGRLRRGEAAATVGHNPLGAVAIVAMLATTAVLVGSGWAVYQDLGAEWLEELHEAVGQGMLLLVGVHVAGVALASWLHREPLVSAMITGRKPARPDEGVRRAWNGLAALMLAAVLGFWVLQWRTAPAVPDGATATTRQPADGERRGRGRDHDD